MAFPRLTIFTLPSSYPCILALGDPVEAGHVLAFAPFNGVRQLWLPAVLFPVTSMPGGCTAASFNYAGVHVEAPAKF